MIPIEIRIKRRGLGFDAKTWRQIMTQGWRDVGIFWHRFILPKHFTEAGAAEYGYPARTAKEADIRRLARTEPSADAHLPLVWSGLTRRMALGRRDVRYSSKGVKVVLRVPGYIWAAAYGGTHYTMPRMHRELVAMSNRDARALSAVLAKSIERQARAAEGGGMTDITRGLRG